MIRKANVEDIKQIFNLINYYAQKDKMLFRSLSDLYESVRDFFVFEEKKKIIGIGALHISWKDLAEIKSLAVIEENQNKGIGGKILEFCLKEADNLKIKKVFTLTYVPKFFEKYGFKRIDKSELPRKIWTDCIKCIKFPNCDEIALIYINKSAAGMVELADTYV